MLKTLQISDDKITNHLPAKSIWRRDMALDAGSTIGAALLASVQQQQELAAATQDVFSRTIDDSLAHLKKNSRIWCKTSSGKWMDGVLHLEAAGGPLMCNIDSKIVEVDPSNICPANPDVLEGVSDLIQLSYLNEPAVLHNLEYRYRNDAIYTRAGPVLVAINPFKGIPVYSSTFVDMYRQNLEKKNLNPHVYGIADSAHTAMMRDGVNQSLIISGESGAGKTETAKIAMQYIAVLGGGRGLQNEILQTNPLLEAFGNAKTLRNNNSSRFGKLIDIHFDGGGAICGAKIQTYLLEKSRVVKQTNGERSYHVFYQLCAGADSELRDRLNLKNASDYVYLNQGECLQIDGVDDAQQFEGTMMAMEAVKISKQDQCMLFEMLAAVLWLGNMTFSAVDTENHVTVNRDEACSTVALLFSCQEDDLVASLCTREIHVGNEVIIQRLTYVQATDTRNALAKAIYACLFDWLVENINKSLDAGDAACSTKLISILDIYGFECFKRNGFEQLCINYANERLQQHFNQHLFKIEQEEYTSEGIDWTRIEFEDNQLCLDLIEKKPLGLISLLDEESFFPQATESSLSLKLHEHLKGNTFFKAERSQGFRIQHYAGEVAYETSGFLDKNRDFMHPDLLSLLGRCRHHLAQYFAAILGDRLDLQRQTVSTKFKNQLVNLMERLGTTSPHFIRCIKPNERQLPDVFDKKLVLQQLRWCGVLEVVRISRSGYPTRYTYQYFAERYGFLLGSESKRTDDASTSLSVLRMFSFSEDSFQAGSRKLFFRPGQIGRLEHVRTRTLVSIVNVQKCFRGRKHRLRYLSLRKATICFQSLWRTKKAIVLYKALKLATIKVQSRVRGLLARQKCKWLRAKWFASLVIQKHFRGVISRRNYIEHRRRAGAAIIIQKYVRGSLHAKAWSSCWKRRLRAAIALQTFYRGLVVKRKYMRTHRDVTLIQAAIRGWIQRRRWVLERPQKSPASEIFEEYVTITATDLEQPEVVPASMVDLRKRLLETEQRLSSRDAENAELQSKLKLYESRWTEYETKMDTMEDMWQNKFQDLQTNLEAAKKCLANTEPFTHFTGAIPRSFERHHRAAKPMLPPPDEENVVNPQDEEDIMMDWDDTTSVATTMTITRCNSFPKQQQQQQEQQIHHQQQQLQLQQQIEQQLQQAAWKDTGRSIVQQLGSDFGTRTEVFKDDLQFLMEIKSGELDVASINPELELRNLKQKFDAWKRHFKLQMREAKMVMQKLSETSAERAKKTWWGARRAF